MDTQGYSPGQTLGKEVRSRVKGYLSSAFARGEALCTFKGSSGFLAGRVLRWRGDSQVFAPNTAKLCVHDRWLPEKQAGFDALWDVNNKP